MGFKDHTKSGGRGLNFTPVSLQELMGQPADWCWINCIWQYSIATFQCLAAPDTGVGDPKTPVSFAPQILFWKARRPSCHRLTASDNIFMIGERKQANQDWESLKKHAFLQKLRVWKSAALESSHRFPAEAFLWIAREGGKSSTCDQVDSLKQLLFGWFHLFHPWEDYFHSGEMGQVHLPHMYDDVKNFLGNLATKKQILRNQARRSEQMFCVLKGLNSCHLFLSQFQPIVDTVTNLSRIDFHKIDQLAGAKLFWGSHRL